MNLINKTNVKKLALDSAKTRSKDFTRVSKEFLDQIEYAVEDIVRTSVKQHPSVGKTLTQVWR